jgi:phage FluMu protein Com
MIRCASPKCQMVLQAAAGQAGATVGCPRCKFQMKVPLAAPVATLVQRPAGPTPDFSGGVQAEQRADQPLPAAVPWYFTRDGKRNGPYTTAQVKQSEGSAAELLSAAGR